MCVGALERYQWLLQRQSTYIGSLCAHPCALRPCAPTLAFASCLCGSPSINTSLQQLHMSLFGHTSSSTEPEAEQAAANTGVNSWSPGRGHVTGRTPPVEESTSPEAECR